MSNNWSELRRDATTFSSSKSMFVISHLDRRGSALKIRWDGDGACWEPLWYTVRSIDRSDRRYSPKAYLSVALTCWPIFSLFFNLQRDVVKGLSLRAPFVSNLVVPLKMISWLVGKPFLPIYLFGNQYLRAVVVNLLLRQPLRVFRCRYRFPVWDFFCLFG